MKRVLRTTHSRQHGVGVLAVLIITAIIAGIVGGGMASMGAGGRWNFLNWLDLEGDDAAYILPDRVIGYEWYAFGCTSASGSQLDDVNWGIVIEPDEAFQLVETAWRIGRQTSGDRVYYLDVHEYTGSAKGTFITRSVGIAVNDILEDTYPGAQPWRTFVFDEEPYLYAGTKYIIDLHYSGSTGRCFISTHSPVDCVTGWVIGYWYEDPNGFSVTQGYPANIKGYKTRSPEVYTIGHEVNLDGSITLHGAVDVVGDMTCGFLVSDDYDLVDGGGGVAYEVEETSGWDSGRYLFDYRLAFLNTNVQYSYRAYASAYSQTWYGEVANFTRTGADVPIFVDTTITSLSLIHI